MDGAVDSAGTTRIASQCALKSSTSALCFCRVARNFALEASGSSPDAMT
jgi:hypothetical protein